MPCKPTNWPSKPPCRCSPRGCRLPLLPPQPPALQGGTGCGQAADGAAEAGGPGRPRHLLRQLGHAPAARCSRTSSCPAGAAGDGAPCCRACAAPRRRPATRCQARQVGQCGCGGRQGQGGGDPGRRNRQGGRWVLGPCEELHRSCIATCRNATRCSRGNLSPAAPPVCALASQHSTPTALPALLLLPCSFLCRLHH